jgi:hypothetical protein
MLAHKGAFAMASAQAKQWPGYAAHRSVFVLIRRQQKRAGRRTGAAVKPLSGT